MADSLSLQQVLVSAPVDDTVGNGDYVLVVDGNGLKRVPLARIKPEAVSIQEFLAALPLDDTPAGNVVTEQAGALRRGPVAGLGGGGIASPDAVALALYSLGMMVVVVGPMVADTDPPQMAPSTAAKVAHLVSLGIPEAYIGWSVVGEESAGVGTLAAASVSITPQITSADLVGIISAADLTVTPTAGASVLVGVLTVDGVAITPQIGAAGLIGVLTADDAAVTPQIDVADLVPQGVLAANNVSITPLIDPAALVGVLAADDLSVTPSVGVADLIGVLGADNVAITPQVDVAELTGAPGTLAADNVTITPQVDVAGLVGVLSANSVSITPQIGVADLTPATVTTITENFASTIPQTTATPWGGTATWNGWTIQNQGAAITPSLGAAFTESLSGAYNAPRSMIIAPPYEGTDPETGDPIYISGFKLTKTWDGPFPSGTFSFRYNIPNDTVFSTLAITVNGVSVTLTKNNTWMLGSTPLTTPGSITLIVQTNPGTPYTNVPAPLMFLDAISYS